ncbi:MAG: amidotransferase [Pseudomonadales bacterium]
MRIGILKADAVRADFVLRHGDYPDMFRTLLGDGAALPAGHDAVAFDEIDAIAGRFPPATACDAYVITGSRHSVYDDLPWIGPLAGFVEAALRVGRPVVGICFGHQLIAHFFGGETRRAQSWCVGVHRAVVASREWWMEPRADDVRLLASHQDQVVRLPADARPFAVGDTCPNAGFVLAAAGGRTAEALTFQGHPEFTPGYARDLLASREEVLGEAACRAGRASLARDHTNHRVVAAWMLRFMGGGL